MSYNPYAQQKPQQQYHPPSSHQQYQQPRQQYQQQPQPPSHHQQYYQQRQHAAPSQGYNRGYDQHTPPQSLTPPPQQQQQAQQPAQQQSKGWWKKITSIPVMSSSSHDGDTDDETVLANALCKFYGEQKGAIPAWLSTAKAAVKYSGGAGSLNSGMQSMSISGPSGGAIRPAAVPSGNSLQAIYNKTASASAASASTSQLYKGPSGAGGQGYPQHAMYGQDERRASAPTTSWRAGNSSSPGPPGSSGTPDKNDRFRNKLRTAGRPGFENSNSYSGAGSTTSSSKSTNSSSTSGAPSWKSKATW